MSDLRLDRAPSAMTNSPRLAQSTVTTASDVNGRGAPVIMPTVSLVDISGLHVPAGGPRDGRQRRRERVAIVGIPGTQLHTDDPVATVAGCQSNLLAKLLTLTGLSFADTGHLGLVQTVQLALHRRVDIHVPQFLAA